MLPPAGPLSSIGRWHDVTPAERADERDGVCAAQRTRGAILHGAYDRSHVRRIRAPAAGPPRDEGGRMVANRLLTPREAESVVEERIEQFGLNALPRVSVADLGEGTWSVRWDHLERVVPAMSAEAWREWLEENVGSLDAGDLETTES
jgi:hypothetical protein